MASTINCALFNEGVMMEINGSVINFLAHIQMETLYTDL